MKKILILTNSINGLYSFRRELMEELISQHYNVMISAPAGSRSSYFTEVGCKYFQTNINRKSINPLHDLKLLFHYRLLINNTDPDLVLTYTIKPNVYGGIACRLTKTPHIVNITGLGASIENKNILSKISMAMYRIGLKKTFAVFFQNSANREFFQKNRLISPETIREIPGSGVNLNQHKFEDYPPDDGKIRFLFIGRIMKAKGIDELFEAAAAIKEVYPCTEFHFIGNLEENYSSKLNELVERKIVCYHGRQEDVHPFIKNCHAVINPSYHEGMSNVLLEAASTGRPVLASNIAGCREIFDEGATGFGFETKNAASLADAITKFINLPYEEKRNMAIAGRKKMEQQFDRAIVVGSYVKEIDRIIEVKSS